MGMFVSDEDEYTPLIKAKKPIKKLKESYKPEEEKKE
jgi:hypothetical protein